MTEQPSAKPSLLEQVRHHLRLKHYSIRTEETYVQAVKQFILYHNKRHPQEMGVEEIRQYLSHLANRGRVSASTQKVVLADEREAAELGVSGVPAFVADRRFALTGVQPLARLQELVNRARASQK
ncbi:MAG TPA: phage integrase N-terminal SAM-like domain-containing protein [Pyrinomonadaceae bacterium]